jgi:hypothetical protein
MTDLTREKIIEIVGPLEDDQITAIIATGATTADVMEAFAWLSEDDYLGNTLQRPMRGIVSEVHEILQADEPDEDDGRGSGLPGSGPSIE